MAEKPTQETVVASPQQQDKDDETTVDVKPDGGYGWVCVVCLLFINATTWGINTTYGVYSSYYLENNYYDASRMQYAWVGGLSVAISDISGPFANYLTTRFNFKVPMTIGAVCVALGQCMAGICTSFGPFLICQGIVFGFGLGMILVPSYPILAHWFDRRLALAQGLSNAGSGIGGLILSNTTTLLLQRLGVRWSLIINGCISACVILPAIVLLQGRHHAVKARSKPLSVRFLWHPGYRWVLLWAATTMMQYFIAIYTIASYASDGLHLSQTLAGAIQSMLSAGQIIGRPLWGYLLDRGGRINMVLLSYMLCGTFTLALWLPARSFAMLAVYAVLQGMCGGTIVSTSTPVAASVVGVPNLGSALAIYWLAMAVPSLCAQPIAIALLDYSVNTLNRHGADAYSISIALTGGMSFLGVLTLLPVKHYLQGSWKPWQKV